METQHASTKPTSLGSTLYMVKSESCTCTLYEFLVLQHSFAECNTLVQNTQGNCTYVRTSPKQCGIWYTGNCFRICKHTHLTGTATQLTVYVHEHSPAGLSLITGLENGLEWRNGNGIFKSAQKHFRWHYPALLCDNYLLTYS